MATAAPTPSPAPALISHPESNPEAVSQEGLSDVAITPPPPPPPLFRGQPPTCDPTGGDGPGARSRRPPPRCSPAAAPTCHGGHPILSQALGGDCPPPGWARTPTTSGAGRESNQGEATDAHTAQGPSLGFGTRPPGSWWFTAGGTRRWGSGGSERLVVQSIL